ncbi:MAG: ABC transporter permease [Oscillospiraceae bacterium]|nr:ABC transporter permease [Oscillospiraceae bacterium]
MLKYTLKRILLMIPTLLVILTIVFILIRLVPGNPVYALLADEENVTPERIAEVETEMGFRDPLPKQYVRYIKDILTGDWGISYFNEKPVFENMISVWEPTILITIYATIITIVIAIPVGIISATHRNSPLDYFVTSTSMATMVIPAFCMSLLLSYFLGFRLGWFPTIGYTTIAKGGLWKALYSVTLPSFALGLHHVASLARYTRSSMLDVLNQDYIRTARAKGLSKQKVYYKHALKNTMSIVATMIAGSIAGMLGGSAVTEKVFNINGMGMLAVDSLSRRDYSQEQAIVLFTAIVFLGVDLLMDILYKVFDPRIEYE